MLLVYRFVTFGSLREAEHAISQLDGTTVNNCRLRVRIAKSKDERERDQAQRLVRGSIMMQEPFFIASASELYFKTKQCLNLGVFSNSVTLTDSSTVQAHTVTVPAHLIKRVVMPHLV